MKRASRGTRIPFSFRNLPPISCGFCRYSWKEDVDDPIPGHRNYCNKAHVRCKDLSIAFIGHIAAHTRIVGVVTTKEAEKRPAASSLLRNNFPLFVYHQSIKLNKRCIVFEYNQAKTRWYIFAVPSERGIKLRINRIVSMSTCMNSLREPVRTGEILFRELYYDRKVALKETTLLSCCGRW